MFVVVKYRDWRVGAIGVKYHIYYMYKKKQSNIGFIAVIIIIKKRKKCKESYFRNNTQ